MNIDALINPEISVIGIGGFVRFSVCTAAQMEKLLCACYSGDYSEAGDIISNLRSGGGTSEMLSPEFTVNEYISKITDYIQAHYAELMAPLPGGYSGGEELPENLLPCSTVAYRLVAAHTGLNWYEMRDMNYLLFKFLLAEAIKYNLSGDKEGIERLNEAYYEIKPFDREEFFKGKEVIHL